MDEQALEDWFTANKTLLENAYLQGQQPWQQSGFGLHSNRSYEQWTAQRKPIADAVASSGSFLDIGCANGFLLECVLSWTRERGLKTIPFGLDLSERLVALARSRLPAYAHHVFIGNAWNWTPPQRFDYVRTELVYVPNELHRDYIARILDRHLSPGGHLLAAEYRECDNRDASLSIDRHLTNLGFDVEDVRSGYRDRVEKTRIAIVRKPERGTT